MSSRTEPFTTAAKDERTAQEVIHAVKSYDLELILFVLAGTLCEEMASAAGLNVAREAFPDRAYLSSGLTCSPVHAGGCPG